MSKCFWPTPSSRSWKIYIYITSWLGVLNGIPLMATIKKNIAVGYQWTNNALVQPLNNFHNIMSIFSTSCNFVLYVNLCYICLHLHTFWHSVVLGSYGSGFPVCISFPQFACVFHTGVHGGHGSNLRFSRTHRVEPRWETSWNRGSGTPKGVRLWHLTNSSPLHRSFKFQLDSPELRWSEGCKRSLHLNTRPWYTAKVKVLQVTWSG